MSWAQPPSSGVPDGASSLTTAHLNALSYQLGNKTRFIVALLGPVAFLPFFFPEGFIMAIPWIGTAFFSNYAGYYTIYDFHPAFIIFFVFPSAILGLERIKRRSTRISPRVLKGYLGVLLVVGLLFSVAQAFPPSVYGGSFTVTQQNTSGADGSSTSSQQRLGPDHERHLPAPGEQHKCVRCAPRYPTRAPMRPPTSRSYRISTRSTYCSTWVRGMGPT